MKILIKLFVLSFLVNISLIAQTPNVSVRIAEAVGEGCANVTDCENDMICFDVYFSVDQPNWKLQSYDVWMDYGSDNSILSFLSEDPCEHEQGGEVNLDHLGKYRFLAAQYGLPLIPNEEVIIHNFCVKIVNLPLLNELVITAGGPQFDLLSGVNLVDQDNSNNAVYALIPPSSLTLNSETLSCIIPEPNVSVRIEEASGEGCGNETNCAEDLICFDVYFAVDQPNWNLQSYNIWMDYGADNSILSFSSEDPCYHQKGGAVNLDQFGKFRFLAAQYGLPLNPNEEVIIHNFCVNIEDLDELEDLIVTAGGDQFGLVSSVNLVDQNNSNNAVHALIPSYSFTLDSETISCIESDPIANVRIEEASGEGCGYQTDCENDIICFDVLFSVDQDDWALGPYNIWMDYGPNNSILSFNSEEPCHHIQSGNINIDFLGKYRFAAAGSLPLNANEEVIIHNFCVDIKDFEGLEDLTVTVGGDHWNLVSSAALYHQYIPATSQNLHLEPYSLTLSPETLSCLESELPSEGPTAEYARNSNNKFSDNSSFSVYPNPADAELFISIPNHSKSTDFAILDIFGRTIKSINNVSSDKAINISDLASGTYILIDQNNRNNSIKFLKN